MWSWKIVGVGNMSLHTPMAQTNVLIKQTISQNHTVFSKVYISGFWHVRYLSSFVFIVIFTRILVPVSIQDFDVNKFKIGRI